MSFLLLYTFFPVSVVIEFGRFMIPKTVFKALVASLAE